MCFQKQGGNNMALGSTVWLCLFLEGCMDNMTPVKMDTAMSVCSEKTRKTPGSMVFQYVYTSGL